jgi:hypothetical protein
MTTVNTRDYLLFQAKRRLVPTVNNIPPAEPPLAMVSSRCWVTRACPFSVT